MHYSSVEFHFCFFCERVNDFFGDKIERKIHSFEKLCYCILIVVACRMKYPTHSVFVQKQ